MHPSGFMDGETEARGEGPTQHPIVIREAVEAGL